MRSRSIVGYTYKADNLMPNKLIEQLVSEGTASPGARDMAAEDVLDQIAGANAIDRSNEGSYDSGDFPKPIYNEQLTPSDNDWYRP